MNHEVFVKPCKECRKFGAEDYALLTATLEIAESFKRDVLEDCEIMIESKPAKCKVIVKKYKEGV